MSITNTISATIRIATKYYLSEPTELVGPHFLPIPYYSANKSTKTSKANQILHSKIYNNFFEVVQLLSNCSWIEPAIVAARSQQVSSLSKKVLTGWMPHLQPPPCFLVTPSRTAVSNAEHVKTTSIFTCLTTTKDYIEKTKTAIRHLHCGYFISNAKFYK